MAYAAAVKNDAKYGGIFVQKGLAAFRKKEEESLGKIVVIPQQ